MELDLVTAVHLAGLALNTEAIRRLAATGFDDVRESHGYLIQHVVEASRPIGEIAERMEVTQQAVSKAVAELVALGYLDRTGDPADARVRLVGLSVRGRELVERARSVRADIDAELAASLGADTAERLRRGATYVLEWAGGATAARSRRVRPPA